MRPGQYPTGSLLGGSVTVDVWRLFVAEQVESGRCIGRKWRDEIDRGEQRRDAGRRDRAVEQRMQARKALTVDYGVCGWEQRAAVAAGSSARPWRLVVGGGGRWTVAAAAGGRWQRRRVNGGGGRCLRNLTKGNFFLNWRDLRVDLDPSSVERETW
jgi:hypothetical protein